MWTGDDLIGVGGRCGDTMAMSLTGHRHRPSPIYDGIDRVDLKFTPNHDKSQRRSLIFPLLPHTHPLNSTRPASIPFKSL